MIEELLKKSDKELQQFFKRNKYIGKGSIVVRKNEPLLKNLTRVDYRFGEEFIGTGNGWKKNKFYTYDYTPLNYETFQELKRSYIDNSIFPKTTEALSKVIENIALKIYPEERVDVTFDDDYKIVKLTIHYPEIIIENSMGNTHPIRDLYVKYEFIKLNGYCYLRGISILRTTFDEKEIYDCHTAYMFSHVYGGSIGVWGNDLCFGATELRRHRAIFQNNMPLNQIASFLLSMDNYFNWESLEGVPYKKFGECYQIPFTKVFLQDSYNKLNKDDIARKVDKLLSNISCFDYNYISNMYGYFKIDSGTDLYNQIVELIKGEEELYYIYGGMAVKKSEYSQDKKNAIIGHQGKQSQLTFKGEVKSIVIDNYIKDEFDITTLPKEPHPDLVNTIKKEIEERFYKYLCFKDYATS